jgi:hypothetical protein
MPAEVNARENKFALTRAASINRRHVEKQIPISNSNQYMLALKDLPVRRKAG